MNTQHSHVEVFGELSTLALVGYANLKLYRGGERPYLGKQRRRHAWKREQSM